MVFNPVPDLVCFPLLQLASLLRGCNVICSLCKPVCHTVAHRFPLHLHTLITKHLELAQRCFSDPILYYASMDLTIDSKKDIARVGPKQRCEGSDWGLHRKIERRNNVRFWAEKNKIWRLEFGRASCEMALISFPFLLPYSSLASQRPLLKTLQEKQWLRFKRKKTELISWFSIIC